MFNWTNCSCCDKKILSYQAARIVRGFYYAYEFFDGHFILYYGKPHHKTKIFDDFDDLETFILEQMQDQIRFLRRLVSRAKKAREKEVLEEVMDV